MGNEAIQIFWSDRPELLAEHFFQQWERENQDPFQKCCVIVHDGATRDWLKRFYLLKKRGRNVLMNLDFVMLPEFLNDFLAAQIRQISPRQRRPGTHPYARSVLPWRIYHILEKESGATEFRDLASYIGADPASMMRRRLSLSQKIADLFDDYLNFRFRMLTAWESGKTENSPQAWQAVLYRKLIAENRGSYAREYEDFFQAKGNFAEAFRHGFPRYSHVHVFDIPFIPQPSLEMLAAIGSVLPMSFWTFNPTGDWLGETVSKGEEIRRKAREIRESFRRHFTSPEEATALPEESCGEPWERLLGSLASGARPLLCSQICHPAFSASPEDVLQDETLAPAMEFPRVEISFHCAGSPRRELEALRDGIHGYLKSHPDKGPGDVRLLCGDWETYAPLADAVFSPERGSEGYLPLSLASPLPGQSFPAQIFLSLLEFRSNRFEVSAVFHLLSCKALRRKFSLDEADVKMLSDLVQKANIRWGADEQEIREILKQSGREKADEGPWTFSWQRGLDRLALGLLWGKAEAQGPLPRAGELGIIAPCGDGEGEEARLLSALRDLERALLALRRNLAGRPRAPIGFWRDFLWQVIDRFFVPGEEEEGDFAALRRTIMEVTESMESAGEFAGSVEGELLFTALKSALGTSGRGRFAAEESLLFAPLNAASALPAGAVWICGLNEGTFPKIDRPASFDLLREHPFITEVTAREKDAFALLKAALGARDFLAFSCFQEEREKGKSAVFPLLLEELADYFTEKKIPFARYHHPQSASSPDYFTGRVKLPPTFFARHRRIAGILTGEESAAISDRRELFAFSRAPEGVTELPLEDLAAFYAEPNHFLFRKRLSLRDEFLRLLPEEPVLDAELDEDLRLRLLTDPPAEKELFQEAERMAETGRAITPQNAWDAICRFQTNEASQWLMRPFSSPGTEELPAPPRENLREVFLRFFHWEKESGEVLDLPSARLRFSLKIMPLDPDDPDGCGIRFSYDASSAVFVSTKVKQWIFHLAGHAAGKRFFSLMVSRKDEIVTAYPPMDQQEARERLNALVEEAFRPLPPEYPDFGAAASHTVETPYQDKKWFGFADEHSQIVKTVKIGDKRKNGAKL